MDIMLDLERLRAAHAGLTAAIAEFDEASKLNDLLETAISNPDDRTELRSKASDFESDWNDKRDDLTEKLKQIEEGMRGIIEGWDEWDAENAANLEGTQTTSATAGAGPV